MFLFLERKVFYERTCFLLASKIQCHKFIPVKIRSLHWNGPACTCKEKVWMKETAEYKMSQSSFF